MRFLVTVAVLTCVVTFSFSRPVESNETGEKGLGHRICHEKCIDCKGGKAFCTLGGLREVRFSCPRQYCTSQDGKEEVEYEGEEEPANNEDSLREESDSNVEKQEPTYEEEEEAVQKPLTTEGKRDAPAPSDNRDLTVKDKTDPSPDYKLNSDRESEDMKPNDAFQPNVQRRSNRYTEDKEADEQTEMVKNTANIDINTSNREQFAQHPANRRRSSKTTVDDKSDELFDNAVVKEQPFKMSDRPSNIDSAIETHHEGFFKHYYKTLLQGVDEKSRLEEKSDENSPTNIYRNRRQAQNLGSLDNVASLTTKDNLKNTINENEEMAIKRHIKKLSDLELEDLLNSLPEEKRVLLNKIIESEKIHSDNLSKRDITKKAGAVEENNEIDNGAFDSSKVQGSSVDMKNEAATKSETTENTKSGYHTEVPEVTSPKKTNSLDITSDKDASINVDESKSSSNLNDVLMNEESKTGMETNERSSKVNNKRETDLNDLEREDSGISDATILNAEYNPNELNEISNEEVGYNCQDEDLSQLISTEDLLENNNMDHVNKREVCLENTDSFKSLEESFPSSNAYKESGMEMAPLVRVKRKNEGTLIKKRSAELVPDAKVAYIPDRAENDDDDSEEGNEFEDEGFYDRTFNYAKNHDNSQLADDVSVKNLHTKKYKTGHSDISRDENIESDTMNIGSDSDSVLSGVEGVDENLMLSSGSRNRRTIDNKSTGVEEDGKPSSLTDTELKTQTDNLNILNYQENDAFGPLPRTYEGDLNRLKRIRRRKTSYGDVSSSNTDV